jgi:hypothetical protein
MTLINAVTMRLKRDYFRWQHSKVAARILETRPVARGDLPFMLLSMVQKRDVVSYLVAVKSFTHFLNPKRIVIVCDPSIDAEDRAVLTRHVPHVELREAGEFTDPQIPRGGTWERLFAITEYARDNYVIQLDADTVTTQPIPEVLAAVRSGKGFVLGEAPSTPVRSLQATHERAQPLLKPGAHIQTMSEAVMCSVGLPDGALYVRGCSGFTGFPPSANLRRDMLDFSARMTAKLGQDWTRWGTEQVTSNYLAANAHGTASLPFPKYGTPDQETADTAFYHFIGSMRFVNGKYAARTRQVIELLQLPPVAERQSA